MAINIKGVGLPFDACYSSCSDIKPSKFNWSVKGNIIVYVDRGIFEITQNPINKSSSFIWICESKYIIPDVYNFLTSNYITLLEKYVSKIFTCDEELIKLHPNFIYCPNGSNYPWIPKQDWKIYNKTKTCSMFCSNKQLTPGHIYRHKIAKLALQNEVDVFGGVHNTLNTKSITPWYTKLQGNKDYMFQVVIENGNYDCYWTEKITDCFATGTIPVYWGTKSICNHFDSNGIIFLEPGKEIETLNSLTRDLYQKKLNAIEINFERVNKLRLADNILYELISETYNT